MNERYIVIEGAVGSGKSALAKRLAEHFQAHLLCEYPDGNPFLEQFYSNASNHGLATELQFLLNRLDCVQTIQELEMKEQLIISDFLLEKDEIFVPVVLNGRGKANEQTLYWQIKSHLLPEYPVPDLLIYLQSSDDVALKRLQNRDGVAFNNFPTGYLQHIFDEYRRFFHIYDKAPLLIVNIDEIDFNKDEHFQMLLAAMAELKGNRAYLNLSE